MSEPTDNMRIWNAMSKTDPENTKPVSFGKRSFTSIDAHWQIMGMTEQFGPVGKGWGYTVDHSHLQLGDRTAVVFADVRLWWADGEKSFTYGPIRGCCELWYEDKAGRMVVDDDAPKKATTDALTKGLSHLGVSADVFLGLFDDNKYVNKMKAHFENKKQLDNLPTGVTMALEQLPKATTLEELNNYAEYARKAALSTNWEKVHVDLYAIRLKERRLQLGGTTPLPAE